MCAYLTDLISSMSFLGLLEGAKILTPIAAVIVSIAAIIISRKQAEIAKFQSSIAKAKLNHELFEKRYALFYDIWGFLSDPLKSQNAYNDFNNQIPKAGFLFGTDIQGYLEEVSDKARQLSLLETNSRRGRGLSDEEARSRIELSNWFDEEAKKANVKFSNYLSFANWDMSDE